MKFLRILLLAMILAACSPKPTATPNMQTAPTQAAANTTAAYPAAGQPPASTPGYPAPEQGGTQAALPLPSKDPSMASLKGRLLQGGQPVANADLYLANLLTNEQGKEVAFSFDRSSSPRARTDQNGNFEFVNLKPGPYGMVYDVVVQSVLLLDPKTGNQLKFSVEQGKAIDAGNLDYSDLPK